MNNCTHDTRMVARNNIDRLKAVWRMYAPYRSSMKAFRLNRRIHQMAIRSTRAYGRLAEYLED